MKLKQFIFASMAIVFLTISCSKDENSSTIQPTGTVTGKLLVKNGTKPVGGALVFVFDDSHKVYHTITQSNGDFTLKVPTGNRTLHIQTGKGTNFRTNIPISVTKDQTVSISQTETRLNQVAKMAYVAGTYDQIQDIVTSLGYTITELTNSDLENYATVSQYDIIFLNCGAKQSTGNSSAIDANLSQFVTNGGSLYASDWAVAYLTGGSYNSPDCGQAGGFIPDSKLCSKSNGASTTITGTQVTDTSLASAIGFTTLDIEYNLGAWQKIFNFDSTYWTVLVNDPVSNQPLMIKTNQFSAGSCTTPVGHSDDDDGWITICHTNPDGTTITMTIEDSDWPAFEAHGDTQGSCACTTSSGTIYYTTFHNHASGNIGNSGLILEYVIVNL